MTTLNLNFTLKDHLQTFILGLKASAYEFEGHTIQSTTDLQSLAMPSPIS